MKAMCKMMATFNCRSTESASGRILAETDPISKFDWKPLDRYYGKDATGNDVSADLTPDDPRPLGPSRVFAYAALSNSRKRKYVTLSDCISKSFREHKNQALRSSPGKT